MKQTNRTYMVNMLFNTTLSEKELQDVITHFMYEKSLYGKFSIMFSDVVITTNG